MTSMPPLVSLQSCCLGKSLAAHVTHKGLPTSVNNFVSSQTVRVGESLAAGATNERSMTHVHLLVFF